MLDTPATLLHRLCREPATGDWERFVLLFSPMLRRWAARFDVKDAAAEDLLQEVFLVLLRALPEFRYDPDRSFRAWLWTVFRRTSLGWKKRQPRSCSLEQLEELGSPDSVMEATEAEYRRVLLARVMQIVQPAFSSETWGMFRAVAIEGHTAGDVADRFGVTANAVYLARGRVLARLREEMTGLED
jgi:RNA polymerase sigma-70 factor (ECF subfamily)